MLCHPYSQDDKGYIDYPFLEDTPEGKQLLGQK